MTRDDIEYLFEAVTGHNIAHGEKSEGRTMYLSSDEVFEFARKIAAHEREACAKVVEESSLPDVYSEPALLDIAAAIRARGQE